MHLPPAFREERTDVLHDFIHTQPFATLITTHNGQLSADHIPFVLHSDEGECGILRGHVARANPLWRKTELRPEVLVVFQGAQSYVTPSWYPSKREHGKVVPTWNYVVVHATGLMVARRERPWLEAHLNALTDQHEAERPTPWFVSDMPDEYLTRQLKGIVGIEIEIGTLVGKWKVSQNRNEVDRRGVERGLRMEAGRLSCPMANLVETFGRNP